MGEEGRKAEEGVRKNPWWGRYDDEEDESETM